MNFARLSVSSAIKSTSKITINVSILDSLLLQCNNFKQYNHILAQTISTGLFKDTYAASRILKFATESCFIHINYSHKIFNYIENSNGFIWNTLMKAYIQKNQPQNAILMYKDMIFKTYFSLIDGYTFPIVVQACTVRFAEFEGREVHVHVTKMGFLSDVYVKNNLINMYAVFGNMNNARKLFDESPVLDSVSWNSLLAGYVQIGNIEEATNIYNQMPTKNVIASNSMIVLFGKCGKIAEACQLFNKIIDKDLVSWTALISCYEQNKMYEEALDLFKKMFANNIIVDEVVLVSVLSASANLLVNKTGEIIHSLVIKIGFEFYVNLRNILIHMYSRFGDIIAAEKLFNKSHHLDLISYNSMISCYMKCGSIEKSRELFKSMPEKDIVSWGAMISGYCQHDQFSETLLLFQEMLQENIQPDETTLVSVISACTHLSALEQGKWVHTYIKKNKLNVNIILGTTIIDMYMKNGCVENAKEVFYTMEEKGVSSYNALILGLAMNGKVNESIELFHEMVKSGVHPNEVTFVAILGACRHVGLVKEGRYFFDLMSRLYKIEPNLKHYGCMVDLLGRAGLVKEAEKVINSMPMVPDVATWGALLGACKKHGDKETGERIGKKVIELSPDHDGFHVLLSNIYASKGNWENVIEIRKIMEKQGVVKVPGCSIIEVDGVVHEFLASDKSHVQMEKIEEMLDEIKKRLKMMGYVADTNEVFLDIDEEEKESILFRHSEKLAIAFGLIAINPPTVIRIMKNLRICNDCHVVAKLISKAFNREIVVRDRHRFHHFKEGVCSCMEYW